MAKEMAKTDALITKYVNFNEGPSVTVSNPGIFRLDCKL